MCEHCADSRIWCTAIAIEADEECEWVEDEPQDPDFCDGRATCYVYKRSVAKHLCDLHLAQEKPQAESGLANLMRPFGVQQSVEFLHIEKEGAVCEHIGGSSSPCGLQATDAEVVVEQFVFCDEHAEEMDPVSD